MLTHKTHLSVVAVFNYFKQHLQAGAQSTGEYLSSDAAEPAVWQGDVARYLGIEGELVTTNGFLAAAMGRKPIALLNDFSTSDEMRAYLEATPLRPSDARPSLAVILPDGTQGTIDALSDDRQMAQVRRQGRRRVDEIAVADLAVRGAQPHWAPGDRLTQRQTKRVGFDMTLSVPKGFSLLLNAGDARLDGAFDRALLGLMQRVEDEAFVRARGEGRSDDARLRSSSLLWTSFKHETSRPVRQQDGTWFTDPHRHGHVFVFNTTRSTHDGEEKLYALEPGPINERFPYFEAVFDNLLAKEVQALGYGVHRRGQS
ncbi:MAG: relaxase domain-containing protein, partial [Myxococcota bacterium]